MQKSDCCPKAKAASYDYRQTLSISGHELSSHARYRRCKSGGQLDCTELQAAGFILIFKPTVQYFENGKRTVKGNVDAELVLHAAAIEYPHYDKAIIVSGDGDFACLLEFLDEKNKLLHILTPNHKIFEALKAVFKIHYSHESAQEV